MVRLEAVGWRIEDVAVMRHLRLVGTVWHDAEFVHDSFRDIRSTPKS